MLKKLAGVVCGWLMLCHIASAATSSQAALDHFLAGLETLEARFEQRVYAIGESSASGIATGIFRLQRPDQFRWDYQTPEVKQVIADGRDIWLVEDDLEQITQYYQRLALKGTPAAILLGMEALEAHFEVAESGEQNGVLWLELKPKTSESDVKQVTLAFRDKVLHHLAWIDQLDQVTQFRFDNMQRNIPLNKEQFRFEPPPDWDLFQH
ncbi:MAG: outer membrane lipoprotein chaperone LolA [Pseudomonadota bacterium]